MPITLLSDFGHRDPYVGVMKGVLAGLCPGATLIDLTHENPPQNVSVGAFWLERAFCYFPEGTVHLAVVDPGVGTERRAIALKSQGHFFVAPDNGLLSEVLNLSREKRSEIEVVEILKQCLPPLVQRARGHTFHGRDLFAPAAGSVASNGTIAQLGTPIDFNSLVQLRVPNRAGAGQVRVRVEDHYGNLITDCPNDEARGQELHHAGKPIRWVTTYAEGDADELVALRGSWDRVEVAVNQGSAQLISGLKVGDFLSLV